MGLTLALAARVGIKNVLEGKCQPRGGQRVIFLLFILSFIYLCIYLSIEPVPISFQELISVLNMHTGPWQVLSSGMMQPGN